MTITYSQLARDYSYDESTVRVNWTSQGLDISKPENEVRQWVAANIIKPLRETDLREQMDREKLRKLQAEAALVELELQQAQGTLISTQYLEATLSEFFSDMKNYMRTIPQKHYIELFESADALELKMKLSQFIDEVLREIGSHEYEMPIDEDEQSEETTESIESGSEEDSTAEEE